MIVDKKLVVSNRKKAEIVAELRTLKFRPFAKVVKAKEVGETEEVVEEEEGVGADGDYDYLLGMAIWSLTKEKVRSSVFFFSCLMALLTYARRLTNFVHKPKRKRPS